MLSGGNGLLGYAWNALREAFYGPNAGQLMLLCYETLSGDPVRATRAVYDFIGEPAFEHDFTNVSLNLDTADFDRQLGAPGLHSLRPVVAFQPRETVLPPDLFQRVAKSRSGWNRRQIRAVSWWFDTNRDDNGAGGRRHAWARPVVCGATPGPPLWLMMFEATDLSG